MIRPNGLLIARRILHRRPLATSWICESCRTFSTGRAKIADPTSPARTRFAPSPTGYLHLGSLRTALFNYLLAKRTGGQFLLRIEDTDEKRTVQGAEEALYDILKWAGLQWDEGPQVGGNYGPYRQSERSHIHKEHAEQLLETKHGYRCFCSIERLRSLAEQRRALGLTSEYDRTCASLDPTESAARAAAGEPYVIRLKVPDVYPMFTDAVHGRIKPGRATVRHGEPAFEDPILLKQDGLPTYHLANVVDDHLMNITHVIRGAEWLPSTPKHVFMYQAFGWEPPVFCHVGLLMDMEGHKLSKRTGDVHISEYRDKGYLSEALLNFVALLGWNNRLKSDVLPLEALVENFSIKDLTKGNTKVNFGKLDYLQKAFIAAYSVPEDGDTSKSSSFTASIVEAVQNAVAVRFPQVPEELRHPEYIAAILESDMKNYITPVKFVESHDYFFLPNPDWDSIEANVYREKMTGEDVIKGKDALATIANTMKKRPSDMLEWNDDYITRILGDNWQDEESKKMVQRNLRYALAGGKGGPGIHKIMMILGEEEVIRRLENVRWYGKRGQLDEKGRVIMTWKETREKMDEEDEEEINDLLKKSSQI
ncbi:Glutamate--tRNA ligase mitochondrial [Orbilia oligospora]|uniref:Glutamate--tRNA ligase, mitochondrial n=1 Tax=Orbilia oligospora TaxID=2813651 RepID=A0A7C8KN25_ORBOL|nr:Glutamate--tRNA ligase mitochondrial [Orbilia oligospora]TGJ71216.1 Glutamate--tRNA ligase mitochondrial [Orbilia oligospora]